MPSRDKVARRKVQTALDARRAKVHRFKIKQVPDLTHEGTDRGFTIGARNSRHYLGLCAEPKCGGKGQGAARIIGKDQGSIRAGKFISRNFSAHCIGKNRIRTHAQRILNELATMNLGAGQSGEQKTALYLAAVHRNTCDLRVSPICCGQPEPLQSLEFGHGLPLHLVARDPAHPSIRCERYTSQFTRFNLWS
jgi:hypothetical protein